MLTRRCLLATPLALAAAAQVGASAPLRLPRKLRVGLWGLDGHVEEIVGPLGELPDVELVAAYDADPKALDRLKRPVTKFTDSGRMLDEQKLDLVAVCNNNGERAAAVLQCASRGLDVIAEKPLALNMADLERIKKTVAEKKTQLGMLLPMRFDPQFLLMRQIVADGIIGEPIQLSSQKSYKLGNRPAWYKKRATYGGTIAWIGIHMIDLMRSISGREFTQAGGLQGHVGFPQMGEMENVTTSIFRLDNGGLAELHMDYLRPDGAKTHGDDRVRIAGSRGVVEYTEATGVTLLTSEPTKVLTALPPKQSVFADFLEGAYNGKPRNVTLNDIYRVSEITIQAQTAADESRFISL